MYHHKSSAGYGVSAKLGITHTSLSTIPASLYEKGVSDVMTVQVIMEFWTKGNIQSIIM